VEVWHSAIVLPATSFWWHQSFQPMTYPSLLRRPLLGWSKAFNVPEEFLDTWRTCRNICLSFTSIRLATSLTKSCPVIPRWILDWLLINPLLWPEGSIYNTSHSGSLLWIVHWRILQCFQEIVCSLRCELLTLSCIK
jgi:hypothetical protein